MRRRIAASCLAAFVLLALALTLLGRSERVSGWDESTRRDLGLSLLHEKGCKRVSFRAEVRAQERFDALGIEEDLQAILGPADGGGWEEDCDDGFTRWGIAPVDVDRLRARVERLRRKFRARGVEHLVDLVAVRSSYGELMRAQERLGQPYERLLDGGLASAGIDTSRDAVVVEVARPVTEADRRALREDARRAPVNVVIEPVDKATLTLPLA